MAEENDVEIISPPNVMKSKVKEGGPDAVNDETLERAEFIIAEESDSYFETVKEDLKKTSSRRGIVKEKYGRTEKAIGRCV